MSEEEFAWPETTRQLAALYQITAAIKHFHKHDWECAITLASAAEGVLPDAKEKEAVLFHRLKQMPEKGGRRTDLNFVQNWLKHGTFYGHEMESIRISEFLAVISLERAITKFVAVYHAETPQMARFMRWCMQNEYPAPRKTKRKPPPQLKIVR